MNGRSRFSKHSLTKINVLIAIALEERNNDSDTPHSDMAIHINNFFGNDIFQQSEHFLSMFL